MLQESSLVGEVEFCIGLLCKHLACKSLKEVDDIRTPLGSLRQRIKAGKQRSLCAGTELGLYLVSPEASRCEGVLTARNRVAERKIPCYSACSLQRSCFLARCLGFRIYTRTTSF